MRDRIRQTLSVAEERLQAAGSSLSETAEILSFHVWDSAYFEGDRVAQARALADVKREFIPEPHPAWSALGTTALLPQTGIIEIRIVTYSPK